MQSPENTWRPRLAQRPPLALPLAGCVLALVIGYSVVATASSQEAQTRQALQRTRQEQQRWQKCLDGLADYAQTQGNLQQQLAQLQTRGLFTDAPIRLWQQRLLAPRLRQLSEKRDTRLNPAGDPENLSPEARNTGLRWHSLHLEAQPAHEDAALEILEMLLLDLPGHPQIQSCRWRRSPDVTKGLNLGCDLLWPVVSTPSPGQPELPPECPAAAPPTPSTASANTLRSGNLR